ncbi:MAG: secondary thiamine-phosphate synthase enzyme YjbQ, partial [Thermoanaerobaculia bacterium]|nr:secondary thiamine-phosphate synthase enzyme YjbQ [Thermoanaerobaculia bacterium]
QRPKRTVLTVCAMRILSGRRISFEPMPIEIYRRTLERGTRPGTDIHDLTDEIRLVVSESGVEDGLLLVSVPGSTAAVTTIEFEPGAVADLTAAIERLAPEDIDYEHDRRWVDGNGFSHVRAALMGPSAAFPIAAGEIEVGTWQQIVLCDFDNRPRTRRIVVQVMG